MVPVADQDAAIAFYTDTLGFDLVADIPFGDGERWVEVAPPDGGTALVLVPSRGDYPTGPHDSHRALDDGRPRSPRRAASFFFRDHDATR